MTSQMPIGASYPPITDFNNDKSWPHACINFIYRWVTAQRPCNTLSPYREFNEHPNAAVEYGTPASEGWKHRLYRANQSFSFCHSLSRYMKLQPSPLL